MIGKQFGVLPSQPPKRMVTDQSVILLGRDVVERVGVERVLREEARRIGLRMALGAAPDRVRGMCCVRLRS